jgi:hypothetical protein
MIASLERSLHVFVEANVQHAARVLPGLIGMLGLLYLTMHLAVKALTCSGSTAGGRLPSLS